MTIVDEIIELAANDKEPIGNLLRKCLILAHQVKNDAFKVWLNNELDGYRTEEDLPDYRSINGISRGFFVGPLGTHINDQPLPLSVLNEAHQKLVRKIKLTQPIASYDQPPERGANAQLAWPPELTVKYQSQFY